MQIFFGIFNFSLNFICNLCVEQFSSFLSIYQPWGTYHVKGKCKGLFLSQIKVVVFIILQNTCTFYKSCEISDILTVYCEKIQEQTRLSLFFCYNIRTPFHLIQRLRWHRTQGLKLGTFTGKFLRLSKMSYSVTWYAETNRVLIDLVLKSIGVCADITLPKLEKLWWYCRSEITQFSNLS